MYVLGNSVQDSIPRAGIIADPHRSLTGAMASVTKIITVIKLLETVHYLKNFDKNAFPDASENNDPKNPF